MHTDDRAALVHAQIAVGQAHEAAEVARLAVLGLAYGADRHRDLELVHAAEQAAHKAGLATLSLRAALVTLHLLTDLDHERL